jgi:hypothetical protein
MLGTIPHSKLYPRFVPNVPSYNICVSSLAAGVSLSTSVLSFHSLIVLSLEATPKMPRLSLLVMLDGEASDSEHTLNSWHNTR